MEDNSLHIMDKLMKMVKNSKDERALFKIAGYKCVCFDIYCSRQAHVVQHYGINSSRHAQSVMGPECSNDHKGSELYIDLYMFIGTF
jgi:hypothetical protein